LLRVCREGEAWPLAAGLITGGRRPIVLMQSTGLFESGDALRNVAFDLQLQVFALIGVRNWFNDSTYDSAREFAQPILDAWGLDYLFLKSKDERHRLREHYWHCQNSHRPGAVLLAE
jgi:sulfopyruvate decarboxylase TPP-binding subunit